MHQRSRVSWTLLSGLVCSDLLYHEFSPTSKNIYFYYISAFLMIWLKFLPYSPITANHTIPSTSTAKKIWLHHKVIPDNRTIWLVKKRGNFLLFEGTVSWSSGISAGHQMWAHACRFILQALSRQETKWIGLNKWGSHSNFKKSRYQ